MREEMRAGTRDPLTAHGAPVPARKAAARESGCRSDVHQRAQDERAFVHARMRDDETWEPDPATSV